MKMLKWFVIGMAAGGLCSATLAIENEPSPALLARIDAGSISEAQMVEVRGEAFHLSTVWKNVKRALKEIKDVAKEVVSDPSTFTTGVPPWFPKPDDVAFCVQGGAGVGIQGCIGTDGVSTTVSVGELVTAQVSIIKERDGTVVVGVGPGVSGGVGLYGGGSWAVCKDSNGQLYKQTSVESGLGVGPENLGGAATIQWTYASPLIPSRANALERAFLKVVEKIPVDAIKNATEQGATKLIEYIIGRLEHAQTAKVRGKSVITSKTRSARAMGSPQAPMGTSTGTTRTTWVATTSTVRQTVTVVQGGSLTIASTAPPTQTAALSTASANNFSVNSVNGRVLDRGQDAQLSVRLSSDAAGWSVNNNRATAQQHLITAQQHLINVNGNMITFDTFRTK